MCSFKEEEKRLLKDMQERRDLLDKGIKQLEYDIAHPYVSDPVEFTRLVKEVEVKVAGWKAEELKREVERYGRSLTEEERQRLAEGLEPLRKKGRK